MNTLALEGEQTIFQVNATFELVASALADAESLTLDLSRVEDGDTAFVQLLLWVSLAAVRQGKTLSLVAWPRQLTELAALLGLTAELGVPHDA
ncbi:STAS domain-containing protein [Chitinibacteraceae bacterium HSL-7]